MTGRITKKQIAQSVQAFAPAGKQMPDFIVKAANRKPRAPAKRKEETLQKAVFQRLALIPSILAWHTPSNTYVGKGDRGAQLGYLARQKQQGVRKGVPDVTIIYNAIDDKPGTVSVLFLELKVGKNELTDEQEAWFGKAIGLGCRACEIRSLDDLQRVLKAARVI